MGLKHILSARQFSRTKLKEIFSMADKITLGVGMFVLVGTLYYLSPENNYYVCNDNSYSWCKKW